MEHLMYVGGLAGLVILLAVTTLLAWMGASWAEALYLSVLGLTVMSYGITEWRLRQEE